MGQDADSGLTAAERARLDAIRGADALADLVAVTGAASEHDAYFTAKRQHRELAARAGTPLSAADDLPGTRVVVDGTAFWVHGITHADTPAERDFLRRHVAQFLADDANVYVEQGIRPMYFDDVAGVSSVVVDGNEIHATCTEPTAKLAVLDRIRETEHRILDFDTRQSSLEDLFSAYTHPTDDRPRTEVRS